MTVYNEIAKRHLPIPPKQGGNGRVLQYGDNTPPHKAGERKHPPDREMGQGAMKLKSVAKLDEK